MKKIAKMLFRLILIPLGILLFILTPLEWLILIIRWVITGRSIPSYPLILHILSGEFSWEDYWNI